MTAPVNIAASLVQRAAERPDVVALVQPLSDPASLKYPDTWTFRQLNDESDRLARGLARIGITRGMRTVLMVPPSLEFYALTFALFKLGAVVVLIDPGMGVKNLGVCLNEAQPEAFIGVAKAHLARIVLGWGKKTIRYKVTCRSRWFWTGWSWADVLRLGEPGEPVLTQTNADETAAILFTSGSTGVAKGAVYTHAVFVAQVEYLRSLYDIRPGEVDLPTFPLFGLFAPALGMTAVIPTMDFTRPGRVDPRNILGPIHQYGVTNLFGSPALLRRVGWGGGEIPPPNPLPHGGRGDQRQRVETPYSPSCLAHPFSAGEGAGGWGSSPLPTLRRVISAGAPVPASVLRRWKALLPEGVQIYTPYGATEALPVASIGSDEILGETAEATTRGKGVCVGRPVAKMAVRIIRISDEPIPVWHDTLVLPTGEIGEIVVSGPVVTREYFNRPTSTALHKIRDANDRIWHRMGDVGYLDEKGRIWFCGRKAHRIVTPTSTLFTIPCEGVFNAHPAVLRTALVGVPTSGGMKPIVCVEIDPELPRGQRPDRDAKSLAMFMEELRQLGAPYSHTHDLKCFLIHPAFPVDIRHNAKIFREKLAVWAAKRKR